MSKIIYQDKTFLQELAEIPEINKVTDNNMNSIKKAINENGQYVSATESNGEFTCTLEGSISQNDIVHILFDTNSTATPASLSVDGGNTFLNILDASGNSINASELSGQSISVKNAGSHFEIETLNSYSSSKTKSYSADYVNGLNTYSTTETRIGTWINGKPIYRKVVDCGALPNASTKNIAHGISNLDTVTSFQAIAKSPSSNAWLPLPATSPANVVYHVAIYIIDTNIVIAAGDNKSNYTQTYAIVEYTKTTD